MKISIIGSGHVGSTIAYTLVIRELASELVLVDRTVEKAAGDAADLSHTLAFTNHILPITAGDLDTSKDSDIIILTASVGWLQEYTTRFDLGPGNVALFKQLIPEIVRQSPQAVLIVVTNPLDIMTYFTLKISGLDASRVLGVGTLIDSARFRKILSEKYQVHPDDIRAYILGEHGQTQFPVLSLAYMGGEKITDEKTSRSMFLESEQSAYKIVHGKGYTNFAISMATALIVESIVYNENRTMPISTLLTDYFGESDVCLSVPVTVGKKGISRTLKPHLNKDEMEAFHRSAEFVRSQIEKLTQTGI
jgi:L-lactate dehydrogenase